MTEQESLPYGGATNPNSGHAGSDASAARARHEDASGITGRRQRAVLALVTRSERTGMTVREVRDALDMHHGQASAALSNLHKADRLARLFETRFNCSVYVAPAFLAGRNSARLGHTATNQMMHKMAALLGRWYVDCGHGPLVQEGCLACETNDVLRHFEARNR